MDLSELIYRQYTKEISNSDKTVYDLFNWKTIDVQMIDYSTGDVIIDMKDLEFPESYSQTACNIIASKYFRKKGVPNDRGYEYSLKQVAHRMVSFWVKAAYDEGLVNDDKKSVLYDELVYTFLSQMWAPNSPQWFNTGLKLIYDIDSPPQGHYYFDEKLKKVVPSKDAYTRTQGSACFIVSLEDSLLGKKSITDQIATETRLFKYGSGVGSNWSIIRGKGEPLKGGGKSSGLLSFLKVFDKNAGAIKSGGTTRRAAKMNILNLDHPEILDFINWKSKEEDKVKALGKMGYSTYFEDEAYETVSGQNVNNSVRIPDTFMNKINDEKSIWTTKGRIDNKVIDKMPVGKLWNTIGKCAWSCGDPGVQFDDTVNEWHTCPCGEDGKYNAKYNRINASNPCSEYMFLDDTACNLASINIAKFYNTTQGTFDLDGYLHIIKLIQIVLEGTIHWGQFPTEDIARKSYLFRTTGLGLSNLGYLFMIMGLPYDSNESRNFAASLMSLLTGYSYYVSSLFAKKIGAFSCYKLNSKYMLKVIRNHAISANYSDTDNEFIDINYKPFKINHNTLDELGFSDISTKLTTIWTDTIKYGEKYGFRNAQVSVLAPTGTISFAMDCATTSVEPFFSHIAYKKLIGGGGMEIVNPAIPLALNKLGYAKENVKDIIEYVMEKEDINGYKSIKDGKIEGAPHLKEEHYAIFDTANKCGSGKRFISPEGHVKMVAALTPQISGSISKTVNMPNDATVEDVKNIYYLSWELGAKAIALYRDGCKASQPLNTTKKENTANELDNMNYYELLDYAKDKPKPTNKPIRIKPDGIRFAHVHEVKMAGLKLYITASFYEDGKLGEIYISAGRQGSLIKGLLDSLSTTISEMLQYNISPKDISKMYRGQKYEPSGFVSNHPYIKHADSISDLISKIIDIELGDFTYCQVKPNNINKLNSNLPEIAATSEENIEQANIIYDEICPNCKSTKMIRNGTCKICTECGTTTGCS